MFACQAYLEARSIDDPMPTWVMNYLDGAMSSSWRSFQAFRTRNDQKLNRPNLAFAEAFQIKTIPIGERRGRSGRGTVWTRYADTTWLCVGGIVQLIAAEWASDGKPLKEVALVEAALSRLNRRRLHPQITVSTAWRAWARYKSRFPDAIAQSRGFFEIDKP